MSEAGCYLSDILGLAHIIHAVLEGRQNSLLDVQSPGFFSVSCADMVYNAVLVGESESGTLQASAEIFFPATKKNCERVVNIAI